MYDHHIEDMSKLVVNTLFKTLPEENRNLLVEATNEILQGYWKDKIAIVWTVEDVMHAAEEMDVKDLDENGAGVILGRILEGHDATYGVTWSEIQNGIQEYCGLGG